MDRVQAFVGRENELRQFREVLESPRGQAVVVIGQQGLGKTLLVNRMAESAKNHPTLQCDSVRFEVTERDDPAAVMELMIDRAFEAGGGDRSSDDSERTRKQRLALVKLLPKGEPLAELFASLRRDPKRNTREQLIERLQLLSARIVMNARAIFVIDPEKYMSPGSADEWRLVVRALPERIKFVFAQRPDDVLASSKDFLGLSNVVRIPGATLTMFDERAIDDLIQTYAGKFSVPIPDLRRALARYQGHPYAIDAALGMLADGCAIDALPADPTPTRVAEAQWQRVCESHGEQAVTLLEAYVVLEVAVPDEVAEAVADLSGPARKKLTAQPFVRGLFREEADGKRIYHSLLSDHVRAQLSSDAASTYHRRAIIVYRRRLRVGEKPDGLAALRLPEHVLGAEGPSDFVECVLKDCTKALDHLGFLDAAIGLGLRALGLAPSGGITEAALRGNLGVLYYKRGDLEAAEDMNTKSLAISEKLVRLEDMAITYGNFGNVYASRGDLNAAEDMYKKSLAINEMLRRLEGMANDYGNLSVIYATRGDLDAAEEMLKKSLAISEKLGRREGMADQYGNLGIVYQTRGDLEAAEEMLKKSLAINEKLGRLEDIGRQYGNLGIVYQRRGDLDRAEKMHTKSLSISETLGRREGMANEYGNLGNVYNRRGDLDAAEAMYKKSLAIDEKLGRLGGVANGFANLGNVYQTRGDLSMSRDHWTKARDVYAKIGMPHMVKKVQSWLDSLPAT